MAHVSNKSERGGDRRGDDRRAAQVPFDGPDRRLADRRSGRDRRGENPPSPR